MTDNKIERHKRLCMALNEIYAQKNHDYGDSFHQSFVEEGMAMSRIRLGDKFNRFKTLSRKLDTQQVINESLRDTLLDLANYAIMTVLEMDDNGGASDGLEQSRSPLPLLRGGNDIHAHAQPG